MLGQKWCWGLIFIALFIAIFITCLAVILRPNYVHIICERECYGGLPPQEGIQQLKLPIRRVIVTQTGDMIETCTTFEACSRRVREIQAFFVESYSMKDIPFNFLIGGDGTVYEGRGYQYEGESFYNRSNENLIFLPRIDDNVTLSSLNALGISVAFIGTFESQELNHVHIQTFASFLELSVSQDWIVQDYSILLQDHLENVDPVRMKGLLSAMNLEFGSFYACELVKLGNLIFAEDSFTVQHIITREDWDAAEPRSITGKLSQPIDNIQQVLVLDTANDCIDNVSL